MGRTWGIGTAVLVLALGAGDVQAQRGESALERAFAAPRSESEVRRRLFVLEAGELSGLLALGATGQLESAGGLLVLSPGERELVRECLASRPRRELVPLLEDVAARPAKPGDSVLRREAQRLLGAVGMAEHARLLARVTAPGRETVLIAPALRAGFTDALAAILARDPAAIPQVPALFSEAPPALSSAIVEALARQPGESATRVLASLLGRSPGLDPLLLMRLAERGRARSSGDELVLDGVRRYLRQRDPALVAAAARACGRLGDDGAVESLIGLIESADERVRASAFEALHEISGLDHGRESARWASWYQAEMRWWDGDAEAELVRVERGRGVEFFRAARAVLEHRLYRARIAEAFTETLRSGGLSEARLACRALEQLGSPVAVRGLIECLEHPDAELRDAAWRALCAITGVELPPETDSWAALAN
jgi:HEAT repeat protein